MKNKILILVIAVASLIGVQAKAQPLQAGDQELNLLFNYTEISVDGIDAQLLLSQLTYGYFQTDTLEWIGGFTFLAADVLGFSESALGVTGGIRYHFPNMDEKKWLNEIAWVPFIGAKASYFDVADMDDWGWKAEIGLKQLVNEHLGVDYVLSYGETADYDFEAISANIGLSFRF